MLIVEGPDGSGKSTLVKYLRDRINWPVAPRVVDKSTNAMVDLKAWTEENVNDGFQPTIFDRHRLISDPIYGPIMRPKSDRPEVYDEHWYISTVSDFWDAEPWVVICLPPFNTVRENITEDPDNDAVLPHIDRIYRGYVGLTAHMCHFNREIMLFDYTTEHMDKIGRMVETLIQRRKAAHYV